MRSLSLVATLVLCVGAGAPALAQGGGADPRLVAGAGGNPPAGPRVTGVVGDDLYVRGRFVGRLDRDRINCLGHAAGVDASVQTGPHRLIDALTALGYECRLGEPESLRPAISEHRSVLMVYLYVFPDEFRLEADRGLTIPELAERYDWGREPWKKANAFTFWQDRQPFDFHVIGYDHSLAAWDWVTHARAKEADGSYRVDSAPGMPATLDPDHYFRPEQVVAKLACVARR